MNLDSFVVASYTSGWALTSFYIQTGDMFVLVKSLISVQTQRIEFRQELETSVTQIGSFNDDFSEFEI